MILEHIPSTRAVKEFHKQTTEQFTTSIESIDSKIDESINGLKQDITESIDYHERYINDRFDETNEILHDRFDETNEILRSISSSLETMYSTYNNDTESLKDKSKILFIMISTLLTINMILLICFLYWLN